MYSNKWYDFARYVQEPATIKNNLLNGIKCHQGTEIDDFNHKDIIHDNTNETEDCKYCGKNGIYITKAVLESNTTWISSFIGRYDYKVKNVILRENFLNKIAYNESRKEECTYIPTDEFIKLSSKKLLINDDILSFYNGGKNIILDSMHLNEDIHNKLVEYNAKLND